MNASSTTQQYQAEIDALKLRCETLEKQLAEAREAMQRQPLKTNKLRAALANIVLNRDGSQSCDQHGRSVVIGDPPNQRCQACELQNTLREVRDALKYEHELYHSAALTECRETINHCRRIALLRQDGGPK